MRAPERASVQMDFVHAPMRSGIDTMLPVPYFISPSLIRASRNGLSSCANVDAWKFSTCS